MIPDAQLERPLAELLSINRVEHERVTPLWVDGASRHSRLELVTLASLGKESAKNKEEKMLICSSIKQHACR